MVWTGSGITSNWIYCHEKCLNTPMNKSTKNIKHFDSCYPGSSLDPISMIQHIHSEKYHYIQHACGFGKSKLMNFRFGRDPSKFNKHKTLVNTFAGMVKVFYLVAHTTVTARQWIHLKCPKYTYNWNMHIQPWATCKQENTKKKKKNEAIFGQKTTEINWPLVQI